MKIQCYEAYTQDTRTDYYTVITAGTYLSAEEQLEDHGTHGRFSTTEQEQILDYFYQDFDINYYRGINHNDYYIDMRSHRDEILIFKDTDEYYYINHFSTQPRRHSFYRCDQWSGLAQWLQDKLTPTL